jgi:hypothetical protein
MPVGGPGRGGSDAPLALPQQLMITSHIIFVVLLLQAIDSGNQRCYLEREPPRPLAVLGSFGIVTGKGGSTKCVGWSDPNRLGPGGSDRRRNSE